MITSDALAAQAYSQYRDNDPLPNVESALLHSEHIQNYCNTCGMVFPFLRDNLKVASYGVALEGLCIWWDESGNKQQRVLTNQSGKLLGLENIPHVKELVVPKNTIMFMTLEPVIRLPLYIAARFNLKIQQVYRGFLAGTGPLVDPGFASKLTFPLHNLTNEEYTIQADGKSFVWIEFTKISRGNLKELPKSVVDNLQRIQSRDLSTLLYEANNGRPIQSSIPRGFKDAADAAKRAQNIAVVTLLAIIAIVVGLYNAITGLTANNNNLSTAIISDTGDRFKTLANQEQAEQAEITDLKRTVVRLEAEVKAKSLSR